LNVSVMSRAGDSK